MKFAYQYFSSFRLEEDYTLVYIKVTYYCFIIILVKIRMGVFSDLASYSVQVVQNSLHSPDNSAIEFANKTEALHHVIDPKITWSDKVTTNFYSHSVSKYFYKGFQLNVDQI